MAHVVAQSPALGEPYLLDIQDGIFDYARCARSAQDDKEGGSYEAFAGVPNAMAISITSSSLSERRRIAAS